MIAKFRKHLPVILCAAACLVFLAVGLNIYDDYGPVSEERNQIDAGHIIWAYITGDHSHYPNLPDLEHYMNRYYGQGATFITVLLEALFGFTWDVNRIWKVRRLWNFTCFFIADICLFLMIRHRYRKYTPAFLAALNLILLPRMFPEVFYNDRDPLFLSWLIFSYGSMLLFLNRTNFLTALLFGAFLAVTVNVRLFGLILLIPLTLIFVKYPPKRKWLISVFVIFLLVWYGLSPIAWKNPLNILSTAIVHLTTKQRVLDTLGSSRLLFAGQYYSEQNLPWFYLPLWLLISTPLMLLGLFLYGSVSRVRQHDRTIDGYSIIDISLGATFVLFIFAIPLIRPTMYSGWRHFYFLYLSIIWFAAIGLERILCLPNRVLRYTLLTLEAASLILTAIWMIQAHPYEMVYYNLPARSAAADKFERDTGYTSTLECLEYLAKTSPDQHIEVMDVNAFVPFSLIGLPKVERERFSSLESKMQRAPMRYIIFNYNNQQGNEQTFPYYAPIYSIERNGTKLAEIFQRTNNGLLDPQDAVESIHASVHDGDAALMLTQDRGEIWSGDEVHDSDESITFTLRDGLVLNSLELFPGDATVASESLRFYISENGIDNWQELPAEKYGTNGWIFGPVEIKYLRIQSTADTVLPWQVRQILLYGWETAQ